MSAAIHMTIEHRALNIVTPLVDRDLNNSVLLDVHKTSGHPEVKPLIKKLYDLYFNGFQEKKTRAYLRVLILHLYATWKEDPTCCTAMSYRNVDYVAGSRYNELHIGRQVIAVAKRLHKVGLIGQKLGFQAMTSVENPFEQGRTTRIWPEAPLVKMFEALSVSDGDIVYQLRKDKVFEEGYTPRETIILKGPRNKDGKLPLMEYDDTPELIAMRKTMDAYNLLMDETFVDCPMALEPRLYIGEKLTPVSLVQRNKFAYRVFNEGSWDKGGRIYGPFWQRLPQEWRQQLRINDQPVVEIDYAGLHIKLLYDKAGVDYDLDVGGDPYKGIEVPTVTNPAHARSIVKLFLLMTINAKTEKAAFKAMNQKVNPNTTDLPYSLKHKEVLEPVLEQLKEKHRPIEHFFCTGQGIDLMYVDSMITDHIIKSLTEEEIPVLTVHDSYLVAFHHRNRLKEVMTEAVQLVTGLQDIASTKDGMEPGSSFFQTMTEPVFNKIFDDFGVGSNPLVVTSRALENLVRKTTLDEEIYKNGYGVRLSRFKYKKDIYKS